jgi:hypothetical protein
MLEQEPDNTCNQPISMNDMLFDLAKATYYSDFDMTTEAQVGDSVCVVLYANGVKMYARPDGEGNWPTLQRIDSVNCISFRKTTKR